MNAPSEHLKCYWMDADYDDDGRLKKGAQAHFLQAKTIRDLNKAMCVPFEPKGQSLANLKTYIGQLRDEYKNRCR